MKYQLPDKLHSNCDRLDNGYRYPWGRMRNNWDNQDASYFPVIPATSLICLYELISSYTSTLFNIYFLVFLKLYNSYIPSGEIFLSTIIMFSKSINFATSLESTAILSIDISVK